MNWGRLYDYTLCRCAGEVLGDGAFFGVGLLESSAVAVMWRWFTYDTDNAESDGAEEESNRDPSQHEQGKASPPRRGDKEYNNNAATLDELDPAITAAILAQAAFRGYRLRERLRRLPAREAEKQIKALHRNARGFRRVGLFVAYAGLYFALVFYGVDISFQRSVQKSLKDHVALVHYGPDSDKTHHDVSSLGDLHQWMQAFYLQTYSGTQVEHPCMGCAVKPPDDVCDACDFDLYYAQTQQQFWHTDADDADDAVDVAPLNGRRRHRRRLTSSDGSWSSTFSSPNGLSEECGACLLGRRCEVEGYLELCEAALGVSSSSSSPSSAAAAAAAAASSNSSADQAAASSSAPSSASPASNFSALLDALDLEPVGGVRAGGGYLSVENVSQCYGLEMAVGTTESLGRFQIDLQVPYTGNGYVGDRNRIIGGMLVTFTRRARLSGDQCYASRDYYHICLADKDDNKTTIVPPDIWGTFRPAPDLGYSEAASGYPVLIDVGGFNLGINMGYCTLLLMDHLDVIPEDEVRSVTVQLVTYNGNLQSAYGTISIDFDFNHGGKVVMKELVTAYILKGNIGQGNDRTRWILGLVFAMLTFGMMRHDTKKWFRARRSKAKRNCCHCCCGFTFFLLILINLIMWLVWATFSETITFETVVQGGVDDDTVLDSVTEQVLALQEAALIAEAYDIVFLLTTLAGLYRWIFQMLTFHARMSIVTDTLSRASTHLDHFLFVFFLVILVFSSLTWLLVGSSTQEFSTLEEAWRSVTRISLGESENFYPQILAAQPTVGPVVVVLYQVLGIVLLLNVVIAILLEAYRGVVGGMQGEDTIFQSFVAFVGMTLCSLRIRTRWACVWLRWRLARSSSTVPHARQRRPSLKTFLQGSTGVYGVDGRLVVMRRRPHDRLTMEDRQLSFNCRRYIAVTEMQALIQATPVPAAVADRLVRKIVHAWVFRSDEKLPSDFGRSSLSSTRHCSNGSVGNMNRNMNVASGSVSTTDSSLPMLRRQSSAASK